MNSKYLIPASLTILLVGCTREAKEDYSEAGTAARVAASKAGQALSNDAAAAKEKAANALVTAKVRNAIASASDTVVEDLDVDTADGVVTLNGTVKDEGSKDRVAAIAKLQAGKAYSVKNLIKFSGQ